ncbi:hypothetical protein ACFL6D_02370 [Spirochaetota bacterium]
MCDFKKESKASKESCMQCFSWPGKGHTHVSINAGQWWEPKSKYWDYPDKRFNVQLEKLKRNVEAGCNNYPILLVDYGDVIVPTMFGATISELDNGPWVNHILNNIDEQKSLPAPTLDNPVGKHFMITLEASEFVQIRDKIFSHEAHKAH